MKKTVLSISMLLVLISTGRGHSSGVPEEPVLRIEMGMHTSRITGIGIDAQNQFIVTGAQDKTVRLWELSTGRLIKIFRPPIGEGPIGMIFAVAVSPDGKTITCGGETKSEKEESYFVYFFDRESGKLLQRIGGLAETIRRLAYSTSSLQEFGPSPEGDTITHFLPFNFRLGTKGLIRSIRSFIFPVGPFQ
jgi:WD40 repeat protein